MDAAKGIAPVWIIGDSHVSAFVVNGSMIPEYPAVQEGPFPQVRACRLGPQLAGTLHRETSRTGGRAKAMALIGQIPEGASVFFMFGEIDCRAHIVRRADHLDARIDASVAEAIDHYMTFVEDFIRAAGAGRFRLGVVAPPPTSASLDPAYGHPANDVLRRLSARPKGHRALRIGRNFLRRHSGLRQAIGLTLNYAGTEQQRRRAGQAFAEQLRKAAVHRDLMFIDMHDPFLTPAAEVRADCYWDAIHLKQSAVTEIAPQFEALGIMNFSGTVG
ncbi:hypothetical protein BOO69_01425 [Sulfitobacter alexandrii]|uniref:SGNH/GDSL hydrolase family protein n=1 Tax=Sulfitobacter alexandrii TaxID=1917485 RepID=A0A1J0WD26_9RHOB|nr:hypothetical protein [Sulfitobacter alexandrii]APE42218.1 hypothetical protein BOO69_01425 [Sulfitobacter alexandrii]